MEKTTPSAEREEFERSQTEGSDLSWALRAVLWQYNGVQRHVAERMQLGTRDVSALEHLLERPELGPSDLATLLGISTASATVLVDRLERAGHVQRHAHPDDRRRKRIVVTEQASARLLLTLQPLFEQLVAIDADYTDVERAAIASYLTKVTSAYDQYLDPPDRTPTP